MSWMLQKSSAEEALVDILISIVTLEFKNFLKINIFGKFYKKKSLFSYFFVTFCNN